MPTLFQVASISKQFTASCVLSLADSGVLDLREPIGRFVPEAAEQWRAATLHDLLTHTSGLAHWGGGDPAFDPFGAMDTATRIDHYLHSERHAPDWEYSSPGYILVGHIVERATDMPYADVLTERILAPLGLADTTARIPDHPAVGRKHGEPVSWPVGPWVGTNDLWSTESDIEAWTRALHAGPHAERASHPHVPLPPDPDWLSEAAYGYGLYTGTAGGRPAVFHQGDVPGFCTVAVWLPEERRALAVLANEEHADVVAEVRARIEAG